MKTPLQNILSLNRGSTKYDPVHRSCGFVIRVNKGIKIIFKDINQFPDSA
jgi:hypothetical protein